MRSIFGGVAAVCIAIASASAVNAASVSRTVDPSATWVGFMNVSEVPENGGAYVFGSGWGTADLRAAFSGPTLKLQANNINDPNAFWYQGGGAPGAIGNKIMDANMYVDTPPGVANGDTLTFTGTVLENTFVAGYTTVAFIKDFAPDFSSSVSTTIALTPGDFSISLATIADPTRHIQYGFETIGRNAWVTDADAKGYATITASGAAVPEPVSLTALGAAGLLAARRRRA
jgi:hypothetical protein